MASNIRFLDQILINPISGGGETILNSSFISTGSITASVNVGTDTFKVQSGSSTYLYISSSGNIGIGTTSPLSMLTIAGGNINIGSGYGIGGNNLGTYSPFIRYSTNAGIPSSSFGHTSAYMLSELGGVFGANDLSFYAGAITQPEIMRIVGSTGFVGIGENSPSAKLEIRGSGATSATTAFRVENANASASLIVRNDGNIGIGTTNPQTRLHISGSTSGSILEPTSSGVPTFTGRDGQFIFGSNGGNHFIYVYMAGVWRSSSLS